MVSTEAVQIAAALEPSDGWFKPDTEDQIAEAADTMLRAEMHAHLVEETLQGVISAVRQEYGD
jgi:hypothetical protein